MKIQSADLSPRLENGVLHWYAGETFELTMPITLTDNDGEDVAIDAADFLTIKFRNAKRESIKTITFTGIMENTVVVSIDDDTTALFPAGKYTYDIRLKHGYWQTIVKDASCIVE